MKNKLRILQLGKQYFPHTGGIETTMQQIAEGIQGEVESYVLAAQEKGEGRREVVNGVPVYYAKSLGVIASLPISWDLVRNLCRHASEYDVIHLHMPFPLGDLACLLSGFKGKLVLYWHSDIVRQKKAMVFYRPLMNWTLKRADAIAIATQGNIDGSPYIKPYQNKCVIIPFGLRKEWEEKSDCYWEKREDELKEESSGTLRLLFIGRLVYYKGCDVLIGAMEKIKAGFGEDLKDIRLRIVGGGVLEEKLKERVRISGLNGNVEFLGKVSDEILEREIEQCQVLIFPSIANSEAFGLVQLEAMAFGKPVINTSLATGVPWVSLNGETGLTVPPGDANALCEAILWMKRHHQNRKKMGEAARKRVKEVFSQDKMLKRIIELYREVCKQQDG